MAPATRRRDGRPQPPAPFERARRGADAADREQWPQAQARARRRAERRARPPACQAGGALDRRLCWPRSTSRSARYFGAITADLSAAATAGAELLGRVSAMSRPGPPTTPWPRPGRTLTDDLVQPLRDRLAVGIEAVDGDNDELTKQARAIYREWKTKRIDDELDDLLRHAYGRGALAAVATGTPSAGCSTRRSVRARIARTTRCRARSRPARRSPPAHVCAPAHAGCRCLIVRAD